MSTIVNTRGIVLIELTEGIFNVFVSYYASDECWLYWSGRDYGEAILNAERFGIQFQYPVRDDVMSRNGGRP